MSYNLFSMAVVLTPLGKFVVFTAKWIIAPLSAAFIGYVLIGPRIGGNIEKSVRKIPVLSRINPETPKSETKKGSASKAAKAFEAVREAGQE